MFHYRLRLNGMGHIRSATERSSQIARTVIQTTPIPMHSKCDTLGEEWCGPSGIDAVNGNLLFTCSSRRFIDVGLDRAHSNDWISHSISVTIEEARIQPLRTHHNVHVLPSPPPPPLLMNLSNCVSTRWTCCLRQKWVRIRSNMGDSYFLGAAMW